MNQSHESNAAWIWRHTAQHIPFEQWQAQQEATSTEAKIHMEAHRAKAAAEKQQRLQALLHQSLAAAAAKFGTATLL